MLSEAIFKLNEQDPNDQEILIPGYGRVRLSQAKQRVSQILAESEQVAASGDYRSLQTMLYNGTLEAFVSAINNAESEQGNM